MNTDPTYPWTPVLDKMKAVQGDSQKIGQFLDWLTSSDGGDISLCVRVSGTGECHQHYIPTHEGFERLLARYFDIDLNEAEKERAEVLEYVRKINTQ